MLKFFRFTAAAIVTIATLSFANTPVVRAGSATNLQGAGAKVIVYGINYDGENYIGQILNRTGKTLKFLRVYYKLLNAQGQIVDVGRTYIMEDELRGSQNGTFRLQAPKESGVANVVITSAEWIDD